ncbi:MAG: methylenetetrahydrofolate reductase [NAD(P)H] [Planctomycetota bacterium]
MRVASVYDQRRPVFSFEFFPPKTEAGMPKLYETVAALNTLGPAFCSITWGAGGTTRGKSLVLASEIRRRTGLEAMAHLSCVGETREGISAILDEAAGLGIENILALRGDPPGGWGSFVPVPGGFAHADELARFIRSRGGFGIAVAGYPEGHLENRNLDIDIGHLKRKVDAGGDIVISQIFYDNRFFFDFSERCRKAGIRVPIVPGLLPPLSADGLKRFCALGGISIPEALAARIERSAGDDAAVKAVGVEWVAGMAQELLERGVPGIHFYALNQSKSILEIFRRLGPR